MIICITVNVINANNFVLKMINAMWILLQLKNRKNISTNGESSYFCEYWHRYLGMYYISI